MAKKPNLPIDSPFVCFLGSTVTESLMKDCISIFSSKIQGFPETSAASSEAYKKA